MTAHDPRNQWRAKLGVLVVGNGLQGDGEIAGRERRRQAHVEIGAKSEALQVVSECVVDRTVAVEIFAACGQTPVRELQNERVDDAGRAEVELRRIGATARGRVHHVATHDLRGRRARVRSDVRASTIANVVPRVARHHVRSDVGQGHVTGCGLDIR